MSRYDIVGSESTGKKWGLGDGRILQRVIVNVPGRKVHVYNTHLCPGTCPRTSEAATLMRRVTDDARRAGASYIPVLLGDFNDRPTSEPVKRILDDGFVDAWGAIYPRSVDRRDCSRGSDLGECGWTSSTDDPRSRIDYVFTAPSLPPLDVTTPFIEVTNEDCVPTIPCSYSYYAGISDHFPMIATLDLFPTPVHRQRTGRPAQPVAGAGSS